MNSPRAMTRYAVMRPTSTLPVSEQSALLLAITKAKKERDSTALKMEKLRFKLSLLDDKWAELQSEVNRLNTELYSK